LLFNHIGRRLKEQRRRGSASSPVSLVEMSSASLNSSLSPSREGKPLEDWVICPSGSFSEMLSSPPAKNIPLY
jgi:hypothetical protein